MSKILFKVSFLVSFLIVGNTLNSQTKDLTKETDPKIIKEELNKCKSSTEKIYKRWLGGSELIEEEYTLLQGCYTNFSNQIRINEGHNRLITNLMDLKKIKNVKVVGGLVGQEYSVENARGTKLGEIKKTGKNTYKFNGERGYIFIEKRNGILQFKPFVLGPIYNCLNLDLDKNKITVMEGGDNNCDFRVD
jgi:hypothetical protein